MHFVAQLIDFCDMRIVKRPKTHASENELIMSKLETKISTALNSREYSRGECACVFVDEKLSPLYLY